MLFSNQQQHVLDVEQIQNNSVLFLKYFILLHVPIIAGLARISGHNMASVTLAAAGIAFMSFVAARFCHRSLVANMLAVGLMGQVCLMVAALKGHPYQIDIHMYFFEALGMIVGLLSSGAIIMATLAVALHHLTLFYLIPLYVFPGDTSLVRVIVHAIILLCEATVLLIVVQLLQSAFRHALDKQQKAESALAKAECAERERLMLETKAASERQAILDKIADEFQASVLSVIHDVQQAVQQGLEVFALMLSQVQSAKQRSQTVSVSVRTASESTASVAAATEELNAAIREIASQAVKASQNTAHVAEDAQKTMSVVQRLSEASEAITNIISVIHDIAGKINLLSLNATIESARAGEAGKGFAVVAGEVKTLAAQTQKATTQISESIHTLGAVSTDVSTSIQAIVSLIEQINTISSTIASAVEEQSTATQEIAVLIQDVSSGTDTMSSNIGELDEDMLKTHQQSEHLQGLFVALREKAERLQTDAMQFVASVRTLQH